MKTIAVYAQSTRAIARKCLHASALMLLVLPAIAQVTTINGVVAPLALDFGAVPVGSTSVAQTVTFVRVGTNGGQVVNDLSNANGASSGDFAIGLCNGSGGISTPLSAPGKRCTYTVTFTPTAAGGRSAALRLRADAAGDFTIPLTGTGFTPTNSIAVDPVAPATVYSALEGGGIYKSTDSGANWTAAATQPTNKVLRALVIDKTDRTRLYAATYGGGVYLSSNSGVDWSACGTQPGDPKLRSLVVDGAGTLYAGSDSGVFVSTDACASWSAMNTGLPN